MLGVIPTVQSSLTASRLSDGPTVKLCTEEEEYAAWDRFLYEFPGAHYFQTYGWLKSYEPMGFATYVLTYQVDGILLGGVAFLSAKVPCSPWRIFVIPHGPVPPDPDAPSWTPLMQQLDEICRKQRALYAQLYPHELSDQLILLPRLEKHGFTAPALFTSHRFSSTPVMLRLEGKDEEDVLKDFRKNTRYYIRRASAGRLVIRTDVNQEVFDNIYRLFLEHGAFRGYSPRPYRSLKAAWDWFAPRGEATFIQAWHDQTLVGAILVVFTGQTAYYLAGAMRREFSKDYPAELMHWHAIRYAMERRMSAYDLTNIGHQGVAQFKTGFRPVCRSWHDPRTKVYSPLGARVLSLAERSCRPLLRLVAQYRAAREG